VAASGCTFTDNAWTGMAAGQSAGVSVTGCRFEGGIYGLEVYDCTAPVVTGNSFTGSSIACCLLGNNLWQPTVCGNTGSGSGQKIIDCSTATFTGNTALGVNANLPYASGPTSNSIH